MSLCPSGRRARGSRWGAATRTQETRFDAISTCDSTTARRPLAVWGVHCYSMLCANTILTPCRQPTATLLPSRIAAPELARNLRVRIAQVARVARVDSNGLDSPTCFAAGSDHAEHVLLLLRGHPLRLVALRATARREQRHRSLGRLWRAAARRVGTRGGVTKRISIEGPGIDSCGRDGNGCVRDWSATCVMLMGAKTHAGGAYYERARLLQVNGLCRSCALRLQQRAWNAELHLTHLTAGGGMQW